MVFLDVAGSRNHYCILMSMMMSFGDSFTLDNYTLNIFNLSGLCTPLNTVLHSRTRMRTQTVQLAKPHLYTLNDHMHLSVCLCTANDNDVCVYFCVFVCVCVHLSLCPCNCKCIFVCLHDMICLNT